MNIAFTTLVILILAVPGYIARSAYQTDKFTRDVLQRDITSGIVLAILYSIPFHFLGAAVINHLDPEKRTVPFPYTQTLADSV